MCVYTYICMCIYMYDVISPLPLSSDHHFGGTGLFLAPKLTDVYRVPNMLTSE